MNMNLKELSTNDCLVLVNLLMREVAAADIIQFSAEEKYSEADRIMALNKRNARFELAQKIEAFATKDDEEDEDEDEKEDPYEEEETSLAGTPSPQITVGDLMASLSRIPAKALLQASSGNNELALAVSVQPEFDANQNIVQCNLHLWSADTVRNRMSPIPGEVQRPEPTDLELTPILTGKEFVNVSINEIDPLPPKSNPFHFDLFSMGTSLPRGWMVMHDGYDNEKEPHPMQHMTLINTRSGQRFQVDLTRVEWASAWIRNVLTDNF